MRLALCVVILQYIIVNLRVNVYAKKLKAIQVRQISAEVIFVKGLEDGGGKDSRPRHGVLFARLI